MYIAASVPALITCNVEPTNFAYQMSINHSQRKKPTVLLAAASFTRGSVGTIASTERLGDKMDWEISQGDPNF